MEIIPTFVETNFKTRKMDSSKFSKIALGLSALALIASVVVMVITFTGNKPAEQEEVKNTSIVRNDSTGLINIAYVNLDTLLMEYKYSIKLNEDLLTEQAKAKANLESRIRSFEKKYNDFSEKMRLGSFISQASMESQQNELMQEQSNIEQLDQTLNEQLMEKQMVMNEELYDSIMNYMNVYNQTAGYTLILGNAAGSSILYAEKGMDITHQIIEQLNERYAKSKEIQ